MIWRGLLLATVMSLVVSTAADAIDYQLRQEIKPLDCTITETSNGSGTTINSDCPPQSPLVTTVFPGGGRPIIRGLFDAANCQTFRVRLLETWYTLGLDPELTAIGNVWILDLSDLAEPLVVGEYVVYLEMITHGDDKLSATSRLVVPGPPITVDPDPPNTIVGGLSSDGNGWELLAAAISGGLVIIIFLLRKRALTKGSVL